MAFRYDLEKSNLNKVISIIIHKLFSYSQPQGTIIIRETQDTILVFFYEIRKCGNPSRLKSILCCEYNVTFLRKLSKGPQLGKFWDLGLTSFVLLLDSSDKL